MDSRSTTNPVPLRAVVTALALAALAFSAGPQAIAEGRPQLAERIFAADGAEGLARVSPAAGELLRIDYPNGGEILPLSRPASIRWSTSGFPSGHQVRLELVDLDPTAGETVTPIIAGTADDGEYLWTPTIQADSNYLVRITSLNDATVTDDSDAVLGFAAGNLTVTNPSIGDVWNAGNNRFITWTSSGVVGTATTATVELSRDGGTTFETILALVPNNPGNNLVTWTVSGPGSMQSVVRVVPSGLPAFSDTSSGQFQIRVQPRTTVIAPNGGELLVNGTTATLLWEIRGQFGPVRVELSRNGGLAWENLFESTPDDGFENWNVSGTDTRTAQIRVTSLSTAGLSDTSNGFFRIETPSFRITAPSGSPTLLVGEELRVQWASAGIPADARVRVELSRSGVDWELLGTVVNTGSAIFNVTAPEATDAEVRVVLEGTENNGQPVQAISTSFLIRQPTLFLVAPTGRTQWVSGSQATVQWSGTTLGSTAAGNTVDLQLSRNGGRTWLTLVSGTANDGSQAVGVNGPETNRARVRLVWNRDSTVQTQSTDFKIRRRKAASRR